MQDYSRHDHATADPSNFPKVRQDEQPYGENPAAFAQIMSGKPDRTATSRFISRASVRKL
ncbi:hypothetical protein O4G76_04140 [Limimaricola sp. G21655-S1]|nr:hypothetical protein [Limimaricola sp. G21655-S1]